VPSPVIAGVVVATDDTMTITFTNGQEAVLHLDANCCSVSYFEEHSMTEAKELIGRTLTAVRHVESALVHTDTILYHAIELITDAGVTTLDWRNESNGYYDGSCEVRLPPGVALL